MEHYQTGNETEEETKTPRCFKRSCGVLVLVVAVASVIIVVIAVCTVLFYETKHDNVTVYDVPTAPRSETVATTGTENLSTGFDTATAQPTTLPAAAQVTLSLSPTLTSTKTTISPSGISSERPCFINARTVPSSETPTLKVTASRSVVPTASPSDQSSAEPTVTSAQSLVVPTTFGSNSSLMTRQPTVGSSIPTRNSSSTPPMAMLSATEEPSLPLQEKFTATATGTGSFEVLETIPHDALAFTQGLVVLNDTIMYEGTGLRGKSQVRVLEVPTGKVLKRHNVSKEYFGEGLAYYPDPVDTGEGRLIQITYTRQTGFIYDSETLEMLSDFTFNTTTTQGWGITYRPTKNVFLVSDGSEYLHTWDVNTKEEIDKVPVVELLQSNEATAENASSFGESLTGATASTKRQPVRNLNELEWDVYSSTVLANVWKQNLILRIHPKTGFVLIKYNLQTLFTNRPPGTDVMNGIALTKNADEVWVTGKFWPRMYRIRLTNE